MSLAHTSFERGEERRREPLEPTHDLALPYLPAIVYKLILSPLIIDNLETEIAAL